MLSFVCDTVKLLGSLFILLGFAFKIPLARPEQFLVRSSYSQPLRQTLLTLSPIIYKLWIFLIRLLETHQVPCPVCVPGIFPTNPFRWFFLCFDGLLKNKICVDQYSTKPSGSSLWLWNSPSLATPSLDPLTWETQTMGVYLSCLSDHCPSLLDVQMSWKPLFHTFCLLNFCFFVYDRRVNLFLIPFGP